MSARQPARRAQPRIAVYAIARDEERHVARWAASAGEADAIVLVDTGSSDGTVDRARALGVTVHEIRVDPFRYDVARNRALDLLDPEIDLCVSLDLDEMLVAGWREYLETAWRRGATGVRCRYEWPWSEVYVPLRYTSDVRIHARHGYRWRYPVHEELVSHSAEVVVTSPLEIRHLRDSTGSRPHYLPLLRLRAEEHPDDGRTAHLLASELRLSGLWDEARFHERRALALPLSPNERLHALLMLSYLEPDERETWLIAACREFPGRREPWCDLAQLHFDRGNWRACRAAAHAALRIVDPADDYLTNVFAWGQWPERLAALASLELGDDEWAVHHARRALRAMPGDGELAALFQRACDVMDRRGATRFRSGALSAPRRARLRAILASLRGRPEPAVSKSGAGIHDEGGHAGPPLQEPR
jgi:hypothetical protein